MYLNGYASMGELMVGLEKYFAFYYGQRPYQLPGQETPEVVYRTAIGGGAVIVNKFGRGKDISITKNRSKGKFGPAPFSCY